MSELTALQILDSIQQRGLVADDIVAKLRQRVNERPDETGPTALTSWLVKNKLLTSFQADELLNNGDTVHRVGGAPADAPMAEILAEDDAAFGGALGGGFGGAFGGGGLSLAQPRLGQKRVAQAAKVKTNVWDSKLMLLGGGGLMLLLLAFGLLYWLIGRGSGDEAFKLAEDDYNAGNYTQAIEKYNRYLENHAGHTHAGQARVHRGLARLRQVTSRPADWAQSLAETEAVLQEIRKEREFSDARAELATVLPKLIDGLIAQARTKQDPALLAKADEAFNLVQNNAYVPKVLRNEEHLRIAESRRAEVQRELDRDRELAAAIEQINAAATRGDTAVAYAIRRDLVRTYPDLENNPELRQAILATAAAEQKAVQFVAQVTEALPDEPDSAIAAVTALASTKGKPAPGVAGQQVFALAAGAAYGLDAATGELLWRRFVGFDTDYLPSFVGAANKEVLLIDAVRNELIRADAATGAARWRLPLEGGLPLSPVVVGEEAWVATRDGRVYRVRLSDGQSSGYFQLPQPLQTPPVVSADTGLLYLPGMEGNLYVLETRQEPACRNVVCLGHAPGTIVAAPTLIDRVYLLLVENTGLKYATLRVLRLTDGGATVELAQSEPLEGQVHCPPVREGNALLVATNNGGLYVFAIGDEQGEKPLAAVTRQAGSASQTVAPKVHLDRDKLWVADRVLQHYAIQESTGQFTPLWQRFPGDVFLQPLQTAGPALVHARRVLGKPGVVIGATAAASGENYWETTLAAPSATGPLIDSEAQTVAALSSSGGWFEVPLQELGQGQMISRPTQQVALEHGLATDYPVSQFDKGRWVLSLAENRREILTADRHEGSIRLAWTALPDAVSFPPVSQSGRLLVAGVLGQVFCLEPSSWQLAGAPFQPRLENGRRYAWLGGLVSRTFLEEAANAGGDEALDGAPSHELGTFLLAERGGDLFLLALATEPIPHLAVLVQTRLEHPLIGPLAELESFAYAVDDQFNLLAIERQGLQTTTVGQLAGPPRWGPQVVGNTVLVATEEDELLCLDASGQIRWRQPLLSAPLAGAPTLLGDDLILASVEGTIWKADLATGDPHGKLETGEPLARGAIVNTAAETPRLLLTAADGSLLLTPVP